VEAVASTSMAENITVTVLFTVTVLTAGTVNNNRSAG
jgi:hypothetical protein